MARKSAKNSETGATLDSRISDLQGEIEKLENKKDPVDTFAKVSNALAVVLVASAIALAGHFIQSGIQSQEQAARQRELDFKAIEISVGILQSDPVAEDYDLRKWAARNISLLNPNNPLDEKAEEQIVERPLILGPSGTETTSPLQYLKELEQLGNVDSIDILSWNVETLSADDPQDILNMSDILSKLNVDVMILQEVGQGAAEKLVAALEENGLNYTSISGDTNVRRVGLAVLFKKDQFDFKMWTGPDSPLLKRFRLAKVEEKRAFTYDPVTVTLFPKTSRHMPLTLIGVHLKSQAGGSAQTAPRRLASAQSLATEARSLLQENGGSVLIAGDFNNTIASGDFTPLTKQTDAIALSKKIEIAGGASWVGSNRFSPVMLDHVVVFPGEREATEFSIELIELDNDIARFADTVSDHRPLLTRVK